MQYPQSDSRRSFLKSVASASAAGAIATTALGDDVHELKRTVEPSKAAGPNDRVQIATIGMGIIGFIDTRCALTVPGVELVAAADLYEGRRHACARKCSVTRSTPTSNTARSWHAKTSTRS